MFLALVFVATLVAFALSAVSGGGAGLVLMPILRIGLPMAQVPVALSMGSAVSSVARIGLFVRHVEWRIVRWFVPFSLPGACLGAWLLGHVSPVYAELLIGVFLLVNLPMLWRRPAAIVARRAPSSGMLGVIGLCAGFVSGLTGAVGLLFNGFYMRYGLSKERVVATRAANEIILHLLKLALYVVFGLVTRDALLAGAVLALAAVVSTFGVRRLLPLLSEALFRRLAYGSMVAAGVAMTGVAGHSLAQLHGISIGTERVTGGTDARLKDFGQEVTVEFRRHEATEVEFLIGLADLPEGIREHAEQLAAGADRVVVEAVHSLDERSFELSVQRGDEVRTYRF
ncbi:MAG: hypothetical protein GAK28_02904 [Luteibacter sp.]|uniref:sulfite exporter TauE/SafE family protein n=1 Tax=Luteibacter sp. TaxID=1886636 RepID=UPI001380A408|nr:sulfite exporter TauE/SafE family protein [Luteibacter sp.]KAF1005996.1 MAG: hypothetical protein GAK28_02904 [Luteibacter sp.]